MELNAILSATLNVETGELDFAVYPQTFTNVLIDRATTEVTVSIDISELALEQLRKSAIGYKISQVANQINLEEQKCKETVESLEQTLIKLESM